MILKVKIPNKFPMKDSAEIRRILTAVNRYYYWQLTGTVLKRKSSGKKK